MHPRGASRNKDDHAIFSKAGPYLNSPDETKRPKVIPKMYKLKNKRSSGKPKFKIETPNKGAVKIIDGTNPIKGLIKAVKIKFKGDGNTYKLRFRQYNMRASYSSDFKSLKDEWTEVILPIKDFVPSWRGYSYSNYPELDIEKIYSLGLQISDKQEGEFELEIKYIKGIY